MMSMIEYVCNTNTPKFEADEFGVPELQRRTCPRKSQRAKNLGEVAHTSNSRISETEARQLSGV